MKTPKSPEDIAIEALTDLFVRDIEEVARTQVAAAARAFERNILKMIEGDDAEVTS